MPTDIATLGIEIKATDIKKAVRELDRLEEQSKKNEKQNDKLKKSFVGLRSVIATIGAAALTKSILDQVNKYQDLSNQLKLVTTDAENLAKVQQQLFEIADDTRGSLEGTVNLYARLARSTQDLGLSQYELGEVTRSVNQAITVSGSSATEANAALFQLGQGLAANALRGQELNSVMEQTPRLARALADGLGVGIAELREMGAAGELTSKKVIAAIQNQSSVIATEFAQTETTISQAMQQIENVMLDTFGTIDSKELIGALDEFKKTIADPEIKAGLQDIATGLLSVVTLATQATAGLGKMYKSIAEETSVTAEWLAAYQSGHISFFEWFTTGNEGAAAKLKELKEESISAIKSVKSEINKTDKEIAEEGKAEREAAEQKAAGEAALDYIRGYQEQAKVLEAADRQEKLDAEKQLQEDIALVKANAFVTEVTNRAIENARKEKAEKVHQQAMKEITIGSLSNLSVLMSAKSKKLFELGKAASLATAVIKGYESAVSSYAAGAKIGGPALGAAYAATSVLATGVQIQNIKSQSFSGGGGGATAGGGANAGIVAAPVPVPDLAGAEQEEKGGSVTINISGGLINEELIHEQLIPAFQDAIENRDVVLIRNDTRNGQELLA